MPESQAAATSGGADRASLPVQRIIVAPAPQPADANIYRRYLIERASWIWHPDSPPTTCAHIAFALEFEVPETTRVVLHVSADQRFELSLDGGLVARGPHRSDRQHWSFESYEVHLSAGAHRLEAVVSWLPIGIAPYAQVTLRGGFLLAAEGLDPEIADTGAAPWRCCVLQGIQFRRPLEHTFHVVGPGYAIDGPRFHSRRRWQPAAAIFKFWHAHADWYGNGTIKSDWALHPSPLPAQLSVRRQVGRVRAIARGPATPENERFSDLATTDQPLAEAVHALLHHGRPLRTPRRTHVRILIDLEDYYCGYPRLRIRGGGSVTLEWAEALYHRRAPYGRTYDKGQRDQIAGKFFYGFGDSYEHRGTAREYQPFWWRAGRYWLLTIVTGEQPLVLEKIDCEEVRYPLERQDRFECDQSTWPHVQQILWRGLQTGAHETFTDSPYYEQMMYVGDARPQALCHLLCEHDDRLVRRGIELFDWSRWRTGFVAERYPSDPYQLSLTFSTIWVGMLDDYALWRDDPAFVRERLVGARCLLEQFLPLRNSSGLLARLPGWSFVDWVEGWKRGMPPGERSTGSASVNLQFLLMLRSLARLEEAFGEPEPARRTGRLADETAQAIRSAFWDEKRGLMAEDIAHQSWSEHAQVLALLAGLLKPAAAKRVLAGLLSAPDLLRCSIYFSHYWLEAMRLHGRAREIHDRLKRWQALPAEGFKTPPERMGDTRSDNHAWSSHPLFHQHATIAGVRPASFGFRSVEVAPLLAGWEKVVSEIPHPRGRVAVALELRAQSLTAEIALPAGIGGVFRWRGAERRLRAGLNRIRLPA